MRLHRRGKQERSHKQNQFFFLYNLFVADAFNARNASTGYYQTTRLGTLSLWGGVEVGMMVMKKETYGVVMLMCYWADGDGAANTVPDQLYPYSL